MTEHRIALITKCITLYEFKEAHIDYFTDRGSDYNGRVQRYLYRTLQFCKTLA